MLMDVELVVKDSHHRQCNKGYQTNPKDGIVPLIGDESVQLLKVSANVHLLHSKHEDGCDQQEDAIIHLLMNHITDHREFFIGALVFAGAVIAREIQHYEK